MAGQKRQRVRARRGPMRVFILDGPAIHVLLCRPSTHYRKKVIQGPRGNDESFESFSSLCPCHVSVIPGTSAFQAARCALSTGLRASQALAPMWRERRTQTKRFSLVEG